MGMGRMGFLDLEVGEGRKGLSPHKKTVFLAYWVSFY